MRVLGLLALVPLAEGDRANLYKSYLFPGLQFCEVSYHEGLRYFDVDLIIPPEHLTGASDPSDFKENQIAESLPCWYWLQPKILIEA